MLQIFGALAVVLVGLLAARWVFDMVAGRRALGPVFTRLKGPVGAPQIGVMLAGFWAIFLEHAARELAVLSHERIVGLSGLKALGVTLVALGLAINFGRLEAMQATRLAACQLLIAAVLFGALFAAIGLYGHVTAN